MVKKVTRKTTKKKKGYSLNDFAWRKYKGAVSVIGILLLGFIALRYGCKDAEEQKIALSERDAYYYNRALREVKEVDSIWNSISSHATPEQIQKMMSKIRKLKFDYNDEGMNVATLTACDSLRQRIEYLKTEFIEDIERDFLASKEQMIVDAQDVMLEDKTVYPFFLRKGELLYLNVKAMEVTPILLRNADIEKIVKSYKGTAVDTITVDYEGIYLLEIATKGKQYASVHIGYKPNSSKDLQYRPGVVKHQVECSRDEMGAVSSKGIKMSNVFMEPKKFTLRGQIKAAFSGSSKALVAVQVPAGATDILYTMRIDTSEGGKVGDGKFCTNLNYSYRKINMLRLPVYESAKSSGILNMILDDNRPIRDEDAYCNMYVFRNQSQAKKFQDGTATASTLTYDVDYSTLGTQSCNGRIPVKGSKTIYLGFENERMRYVNYLWVEVVAVIPTTLYFKEKYSIK